MNELHTFFERFRKIELSYEGDKTDWKEKHRELQKLYYDISHYRLRYTKNVLFYEWIKRHLTKEISDEETRISLKAIQKEFENET